MIYVVAGLHIYTAMQVLVYRLSSLTVDFLLLATPDTANMGLAEISRLYSGSQVATLTFFVLLL